MSKDHHFLIRYGLHHFVHTADENGKKTFTINKKTRDNMVAHAKYLITDFYGEHAQIRVN